MKENNIIKFEIYLASNLREKLKKDPNIKIINIRGFGYKLIC